ncbi:MAG TPA: hypothetical protein GX743_03785 [Actinomycetales bacterium]|nr:hypothetical protein [Actinomycetales bacterium]
MTWVGWVVLAVVVLGAISAIVLMRVRSRAEILNTEVIRTGAMLERSLRARALMTLELARSPHIDPATAVILVDIAGRCLEDEDLDYPELGAQPSPERVRERALCESELTRGLRVIVPQLLELTEHDPGLRHHVDRLVERWRLVGVARTLHNSRVAQAVEVHGSPLGRLAGVRTPAHVTFDMDDALPEPMG